MRPSFWILISTALAGLGYAGLRAWRQPPPDPLPAPRSAVLRHDAPAPAESTTVTGIVLDRLGLPIAGALVSAERGEPQRTTAEGAFRLGVARPGGTAVRIEAHGRRAVVRPLLPGEPNVVVLEDSVPWITDDPVPPTDRGLLGEGFVKDSEGQPVPHASVLVLETGTRAAGDDGGRFRIALPDGAATLLAWDERGGLARSEPVFSMRRQGLVPLPDLVLEQGATARGWVRDAAGAPCPGAAVVVRGQGVERQALCDQSGAFVCRGLPEGGYVVEAMPWRGALGSRRELALAGRGRDFDLTLVPARPLVVAVADATDGSPCAGMHVLADEAKLRRAHAVTDAEGKARLEGLGPGPFAFEVREPSELRPLEVVSFAESSGRIVVRR